MAGSKLRVPETTQFSPAGFFALRTPLLPFEELLRWSEGLEAPTALADPSQLEEALAADRHRLRARLRTLVARPELREALFVASPVLDESLESWLREPISERGLKVERTLVRYFARMAGRATPFGLFAGCSVGLCGERSELVLEGREQYQRHTRLDMDYISALTDALAQQPELREVLTFHPNSSLYATAGQLRYAEARREGRARSYHLVAVEPDDSLRAALERAHGGVHLAELAEALAQTLPDVTAEETREFVDELVESQLLVPALAPAVTGPEPLEALLAQLQELPAFSPVREVLEQVGSQLAALDRDKLGSAPERYLSVAQALEGLAAPVELPRLFQVDLVKPVAQATLGPEVLEEVARGVRLLQQLTPRSQDEALVRFRQAFLDRYETREVALAEALDEENGIGFAATSSPGSEAAPLLHGFFFPPAPPEAQGSGGARAAHLLPKLQEVVRRGLRELVLEPRDLEALSVPEPQMLPDAFAVMGTLVAASEQAVTEGHFRFCLELVSGPSGAPLLGRFCHADPVLRRHVEAHLRAEEALRPEALFAEIVHLPEGRLGNILCRPVLREHELAFLGRSGAPPEQQLPVTDLSISVQGERVVLRSARLGREVVPRMTNAHNYERQSLGVYRFLCSLQKQEGGGSLRFGWGALAAAEFLPRVVAGRTVLSLARWRVPGQVLARWGQLEGAARYQAVQAFRQELRLPRHVALEDGDNILPVDLDNVLGVESLTHLIKARPFATLMELFPEPDELCARGPEGRFVHELVIPFLQTRRQQHARGKVDAPAISPVSRSFPPGSEWLYARIYTGTASADRLLSEAVAPLVQRVMAAGHAERWFFLRYGDPSWHLRLRFQGHPRRLRDEVLPALKAALEPALRDGSVWRLQLDTYEREVERYGGPEGVVLAERLFQEDSQAALGLLEGCVGDEGEEARWRLTLLGMDLLLADLGLSLEARTAVVERAREAFGQEFRVTAAFERQLGERFRQERGALEALLAGTSSEEDPWAAGVEVLRERSARLVPVATALREAERAGRLSASLAELAPSYLHMHANRMLRSAARAQELVLYDFLGRLYRSRLARSRGRM
jgi:thiopeptide-type bacteriocin biosynthesis protein